ncbi:MAG TPA: hypothetical protein VFO60_02000 [Candidatus Dormibacteraeota bacterium]|nr:hypothetical protein [Candidatus Dormibacteraeota bacterium]
MPGHPRIAAVLVAALALAASGCGSTAPTGAGTATPSAAPPAGGAGPTPGDTDAATAAAGTPTPEPTAAAVADPCALIAAGTILTLLHATAATTRVDPMAQAVPDGQGCDYAVSGAIDAEVFLALEPASDVDTSSGGFTVAGHPAAYRQTEGGAAEVDVTIGASSAVSVSVTLRDAGSSADAARPQAEALAAAVVAAYHPA